MLAIWSLVPLPFLNPAWTSRISQFMYCWSQTWRILSMTLLAPVMSQLCSIWNTLWHCLSSELEWKLTFSSPVAIAEFSKFAGILRAPLSQHHLLGFWNSSSGIPSPPLALFVVMLLNAHLTSHARMSGSRWVTTPSWLSGSWRSFLYSFSVYSCQLFLISSVFVRSIQFLSYMVPIFGWNVPFVSLIFLKRSLVFSFLLFFYISLHWSLMKGFLSLLAILWNSTFKWFYLPWEIQLSYFTS